MPKTLMSLAPGQWLFVGAPVHALLLHVLEDALASLLAAQARVAPATEGRGDGELLVGVDPDGAGLHRAAQAPGTLEVAAPHTRCQRIHAVVGLLDQLFLAVERHGHQHRAE